MSQDVKSMLGTVARVFVAASLAQFIAGGSDAFALSGDALRAIVSSGVAAAATAAFNWLNPTDGRYGRKA